MDSILNRFCPSDPTRHASKNLTKQKKISELLVTFMWWEVCHGNNDLVTSFVVVNPWGCLDVRCASFDHNLITVFVQCTSVSVSHVFFHFHLLVSLWSFPLLVWSENSCPVVLCGVKYPGTPTRLFREQMCLVPPEPSSYTLELPSRRGHVLFGWSVITAAMQSNRFQTFTF